MHTVFGISVRYTSCTISTPVSPEVLQVVHNHVEGLLQAELHSL
jgi:hypothetical protein